MSRQERLQRKVYRARRHSIQWMAAAMAAVSIGLMAVGFTRAGGGADRLAVEPSLPPEPTPVTRTFDETEDQRQLAVPDSAWFAIQLGVFEAEESALKQAETYRSRGAAGYIWREDGRCRVLAAVYPDEEDAKSVRTRLKAEQSIDSYVFAIEPVELTLKISGMAGQLDVLEAIYAFWQNTTLQLQKWSVELDQRETDAKQLRVHLADTAAAAGQLTELVSQRFTQPYHAAVEPAAELLETLAVRLEALAEDAQASSVRLGAELKYETLWLIAGIRQYYDQLIR